MQNLLKYPRTGSCQKLEHRNILILPPTNLSTKRSQTIGSCSESQNPSSISPDEFLIHISLSIHSVALINDDIVEMFEKICFLYHRSDSGKSNLIYFFFPYAGGIDRNIIDTIRFDLCIVLLKDFLRWLKHYRVTGKGFCYTSNHKRFPGSCRED